MALPTVVSDILWNMDILGSITNHQTLWVDGDKLGFDTRYMQWLRRPLTGDSREHILHAVKKTLTLFDELLQSYTLIHSNNRSRQDEVELDEIMLNNLHELNKREDKVNKGLSILSTFERYNGDSAFRMEVERLNREVQRLCQKSRALVSKMNGQLGRTSSLHDPSHCPYLNQNNSTLLTQSCPSTSSLVLPESPQTSKSATQ